MSHLHEKVSALVDGELQGSARRRALDHLGRCGACSRELHETLALKQRLTGMSCVDPPSEMFAALGRAPAAARRGCPQPGSTANTRNAGPTHRRPWRLLIGAGSVTLVVLTVAYAVGGPSDLTNQQVTPPVDDLASELGAMTSKNPLSDAGMAMLVDSYGASSDSWSSASQHAGGLGGSSVQTVTAGPAEGSEQLDDPRALQLLLRAEQAPGQVGYVGIEQVQSASGGDSESTRVAVDHVPSQGTTFGATSGGAVSTAAFVPQGTQATTDSSAQSSVGLLSAAYDVALEGSQHLLGRSCTLVLVSSAGQPAARFWLDDETGLMLRRQLFDRGRLVRSSGFTHLHVRAHGFLSHLPPTLEALSTSPVPKETATALADEGWAFPSALDGILSLAAVRRVQAGSELMQAVYTDGLSSVSVSEQQGSLDAEGLDGFSEQSVEGTPVYVRHGLVTSAVWESDGTVFTVVTDGPPRQAQSIVDDLPHLGAAPAPGITARIQSGLSELASAVG